MGEGERPIGRAIEGAAGDHQVTHEGGRHQTVDHLVIEGRCQLTAHIEEVVQLEDLHGEALVDALELVVDEPVLDGRSRAGGHALQKCSLLVGEGTAVGPRPEAEDRNRPVGLEDRAQHLEAARLEYVGADPLPAKDHLGCHDRAEVDLRGRPGRQPTRSLDLVAAALRAYEEGPARGRHLPHHDEEGGIQDFRPRQARVQRGGEVQEGDQLRHPLQQRRGAALAAERVESALVLEHNGRVHGQRAAAGSFRFTRLQTLRRADRRKVTESMIFSIRWTPRPPVRRSLT